jgi:hypothetical protein
LAPRFPRLLNAVRSLTCESRLGPGANLLYFSSSHYAINAEQTVMRQSTMTIGVLGAPAAEAVHRSVRKRFGSHPADTP